MTDRKVLETLLRNAAGNVPRHLKSELAYRHMIAMADTLDVWAQDERSSPAQTAELLGWADSFRRIAEEVGPSWNPPTPATVSIAGFLGRLILNEPSPPPTPQLSKPDIPLRKDSVLASPLAMFQGWGLSIVCGKCTETRLIPVNQIAGFSKPSEQVASVIARLRCHKCAAPPSSIQLQEGSNSPTARKVLIL